MPKLIGIPGSLRQGSYNRMLLAQIKASLPSDWEMEIASLDGIPLYDGDVEKEEGVPEAAHELKDKLAEAEGVVIATPGGRGTEASQEALLPVLRVFQVKLWLDQPLYVSRVSKCLDEAGEVTDPELKSKIQNWVNGFLGFVSS